jgi:hypothetical protein
MKSELNKGNKSTKNVSDYKIEITCERCGTKKIIWKAWTKNGMGKYCSRRCSSLRANGRKKTKFGYIEVLVGNKYIKEHRLIMENYLGRKLLPTEIIHHINGIKSDNNISNLRIMKIEKHHSHHAKNRKRDYHGRFNNL